MQERTKATQKKQPNKHNPGGQNMPIGFISPEEEQTDWVDYLINHILNCFDEDCYRCTEAVRLQLWTYRD